MSIQARIPHERLHHFVTSVYVHLGMPDADAELLADTLVQADLWGHQSHGTLRTPWYARRILTGAMAAATSCNLVVDAGAVAVVDGNDGIGQVITKRATDEAVRRAKAHGVSAIAVRNSGHFGTAMYFTRRMAADGCIGILTTNASPAMPPWGGIDRIVGNNPWSIAAPMQDGRAMVLDIANTAVARGKIYLARQRGEEIPDGWAMTSEGVPTTDPAAAIAGMIMPMAGHKGYGISVMMDVLSGVLSGSMFGPGVHGPYEPAARSGCGHLVIALDIAHFRPLDTFLEEIERMAAGLKSSALAKNSTGVFYPGEPEEIADAHNRACGIELPRQTLDDLNILAGDIGTTERLTY
ncbi:MAG: hypothetical protein RLZ98_3371 [Pseudomonadota bacterium]|jgi:LDH2 family malate/lactate/ureidoglycolate dehydrogenase